MTAQVKNTIAGKSLSAGFSLMELMSAMTVAAIILTAGIPGMLSLVNQHTMNVTARTLLGSLIYARSEAIKSGGRITVAGRDGDWSEGWEVFDDVNSDGLKGADERLFGQTNRLGDRYRLSGNNPVKSYVSYTATGQSERISGALQMGTITLCDEKTGHGVKLVISSSGRPRIDKKGSVDGCSVS